MSFWKDEGLGKGKPRVSGPYSLPLPSLSGWRLPGTAGCSSKFPLPSTRLEKGEGGELLGSKLVGVISGERETEQILMA